MSLSKEDILNSNDVKIESVVVPEWKDKEGNPGIVYIKQMCAKDLDKFEEQNRGKNGGPNLVNIRARMVAACLCDENGNTLFDDSDLVKLSNKSAAVLNRLIDKINELNSVTEEDLDTIAKN